MRSLPGVRGLPLFLVLALCLASWSLAGGWKPGKASPRAGWTPSQLPEIQATIDAFVADDPRLEEYFEEAHAYAIFPKVGKGAFFVGGAYGKGRVFERGKLIGNTSLTQVSLGLQFGGQGYSEVIFFRDRAALDKFRKGRSEFRARASAVAADAGASADSAWEDGVAVFTRTKGGLMAEASLGGQGFKYTPLAPR